MADRTPASRGKSRSLFSRFLSYVYLPIMGAGILALLFLVLSVSSQVQDVKTGLAVIKTAQGQLQANQRKTCLATNKARRDSNRNIRMPLKRAVTIASGGSAEARAKAELLGSQEAARFDTLADTERDPAVKAILTVLSTALRGNPKLAEAYAALAADVQLSPLLDCGKAPAK